MGIIITFSSDIFQMYKGEQSVLALNEPHGLENPWTRNVETVSFMDLTPQQEQNYENLQKTLNYLESICIVVLLADSATACYASTPFAAAATWEVGGVGGVLTAAGGIGFSVATTSSAAYVAQNGLNSTPAQTLEAGQDGVWEFLKHSVEPMISPQGREKLNELDQRLTLPHLGMNAFDLCSFDLCRLCEAGATKLPRIRKAPL
jgi:hypothetical protein